jgi:hypothetical protein
MAYTKAILFRFPSYGIYRHVDWYINNNVGGEVAASETLVTIYTNIVYQKKELVALPVVDLEISTIQPKNLNSAKI